MKERISFNRPFMTGRELSYIADAHHGQKLAGDGPYTKRCNAWIEAQLQCEKALLTHSCTAALEMAAILADIKPGDEVIMPSYTFVSTANAFVLRGGVPVFIDVHPDTMNINENLIEAAITERTRAVVPVHYAGVACEMDTINHIAEQNDLWVIEDAAQAFLATYKGRMLGTMGDFGALSFHETKNIISGEGGCILVNRPEYVPRAEIVREKGTNRSSFHRGEVDKYTWHDVGSSYLPGEIIAAFLWAQLEEAKAINDSRFDLWSRYHLSLASLESSGLIRRPTIPADRKHNAHMYYVVLSENIDRDALLAEMRREGVDAVFHYVPLHSSPGGKKFGRTHGEFSVTDNFAQRLIRLPLWIGMTEDMQQRVVATLSAAARKHVKSRGSGAA